MPRVTKSRSMLTVFRGMLVYSSTFSPRSGTIVRTKAESKERYTPMYEEHPDCTYKDRAAFEQEWKAVVGDRNFAFSPVPEVLDVKITGKCGFGCTYCYMDSTPNQEHPDALALVKAIFRGCGDVLPYQIAYGGGEPTGHPDFPAVLRYTAESGVVPNYTTAGHIFRPDVIEATNECVGGVSLTYHRHKGIEWFKQTYEKWSTALDQTVTMGVHVIADKNVALAIRELHEALGGWKKHRLHIILLAYYPDVGRGQMTTIMPKQVYMVDLPAALTETAVSFAYSEGLLPYFLSRPGLIRRGSAQFSGPQEGIVSAYVDEKGYVSTSSFDPPRNVENLVRDMKDPDDPESKEETEGDFEIRKKRWAGPNVLTRSLRDIWRNDRIFQYLDHAGTSTRCYGCKLQSQCVVHNIHHQLVCAWQKHNSPKGPPLTDEALEQQAFDAAFAALEAKQEKKA